MKSKDKQDILVVDLIATTPIYTAYFCDSLSRIGLSTDLISPANIDELSVVDHLDVNFISSQKATSNPLKKFFFYLIKWIKVISISKKYNAIHFQWFPLLSKSKLDLFFLKFLYAKNKNLFYTVHNILPHDSQSNKVKKNHQDLYDFFPFLVVHTQKTKKRLITDFSADESKIIEIKHGPIFSELAIRPQKSTQEFNSELLRISMIGNIRPYKGYEEAIKLLALTKETSEEFKLYISGQGHSSYIQKLSEMTEKLQVTDLCNFNLGYIKVENMIEMHQKTDAILVPYKNIDQSGAAITALSLGKPVLGYCIGGLVDLITNYQNGFLTESGNLKELKEGIKWLKSKDQIVLFNNCLKSLDSISWEKSAKKLASYYSKK